LYYKNIADVEISLFKLSVFYNSLTEVSKFEGRKYPDSYFNSSGFRFCSYLEHSCPYSIVSWRSDSDLAGSSLHFSNRVCHRRVICLFEKKNLIPKATADSCLHIRNFVMQVIIPLFQAATFHMPVIDRLVILPLSKYSILNNGSLFVSKYNVKYALYSNIVTPFL
jgi:hypothetical protein